MNSVLRWAHSSGRIFSLFGWFGLHQIPNSLAGPQAYSFPSLPFDSRIIPRLMLAGKKKICLVKSLTMTTVGPDNLCRVMFPKLLFIPEHFTPGKSELRVSCASAGIERSWAYAPGFVFDTGLDLDSASGSFDWGWLESRRFV